MNDFNVRASAMNKWLCVLFSLLLSACANEHNFVMGDSYLQVKNVQTLDPEASVRNDGLVLSLEGNYGRKVMLKYRDSNEAPIKAKELGASIIMD
ncbi:hypothetical protein [Shewanella algidipiscicola]|uniref:Lipoprotein n=1 Tax=Shewanella algidipiscicola TaxID=614070 RepID=A0ABQ4PN19_9GAMM|nr:hypothetical protein [Shewanella algidipiscicola]GIU49789.1 hypothetical protein TUM4630_29250 [Shewanella algidipiscicola]